MLINTLLPKICVCWKMGPLLENDDDDPLIHWWINQNANNNPKHQHVFLVPNGFSMFGEAVYFHH